MYPRSGFRSRGTSAKTTLFENHAFINPLKKGLNSVALGVKIRERNGERKKPINIKNFGGTPPGVRPVCPGDTSRLSRDMSRLSRGHSVPLVLTYT